MHACSARSVLEGYGCWLHTARRRLHSTEDASLVLHGHCAVAAANMSAVSRFTHSLTPPLTNSLTHPSPHELIHRCLSTGDQLLNEAEGVVKDRGREERGGGGGGWHRKKQLQVCAFMCCMSVGEE